MGKFNFARLFIYDAFALLPSEDLAAWTIGKLCESIVHTLRMTPCLDTLVSPLEILTGRRRQPKNLYAQPVDVSLVRTDLVEREHNNVPMPEPEL